MLQDTATTDDKYLPFVKRVAATKLVWGLMDKKGWANTTAHADEETNVIPFWSERAYAKACARDDWRGYTATEIPLAEFLESWCLGMDENDTLSGIDWDANMLGPEAEALQVAFDILTQLKNIGSAIKFKNYSSIDEFLGAISESAD